MHVQRRQAAAHCSDAWPAAHMSTPSVQLRVKPLAAGRPQLSTSAAPTKAKHADAHVAVIEVAAPLYLEVPPPRSLRAQVFLKLPLPADHAPDDPRGHALGHAGVDLGCGRGGLRMMCESGAGGVSELRQARAVQRRTRMHASLAELLTIRRIGTASGTCERQQRAEMRGIPGSSAGGAGSLAAVVAVCPVGDATGHPAHKAVHVAAAEDPHLARLQDMIHPRTQRHGRQEVGALG